VYRNVGFFVVHISRLNTNDIGNNRKQAIGNYNQYY
jgi:hypothetical protein